MTREKKEIVKKIRELTDYIEADVAMGCGFAPEGAYSKTEEEIMQLSDRLARLQGFKDEQEKADWEYKNLPMNVIAIMYGWY